MLSNVYAVLSFLGLVFVLIPLPWNLRSWNVGVCALIFNVALGCLVLFVNHIIWSGTVEDKAPAWCDISAKLLVGIRIGVPAACLCITRRLFSIIRGGHSYLTQPQRTRVMLVDLALSAGVPLLIIALHCIVQSHRFDIIEDVGCWPATFNSIAAYPLVLIWPLLLSFGSCIYYLMCTYIVFTRRASIPSVLDASSTVTTKQLYRLLALLAIMLLYLIPSNAYLLWLNARLQPFLSQSQANYDFPRVDMLPSAVWETNSSLNIFIQMNVWVYSGFAFLISALLALTPEAYECYRTFLNHLGCRQLSPPSKGSISRPRWLSWMPMPRAEDPSSKITWSFAIPSHSNDSASTVRGLGGVHIKVEVANDAKRATLRNEDFKQVLELPELDTTSRPARSQPRSPSIRLNSLMRI